MNHVDEENAAMLASIMRTAIDAIITIDDHGIIRHANDAVEKLFGYTLDEVLGKNISILMPEPDRSRHDRYLSRYSQTKQAAIIGIGREVLGQRKDGSLIALDLAVSEIEVGGQVLFTGILRDMTQRNESEANLRRAEQKSIQSERLAAIGQMMTGLAHESRNALQRSRACLDILELELLGQPDQQNLVQRIQSAILELQTLYEEVKNYAAPIALERSDQKLEHLCNEAWSFLLEELRPEAIELVIRCQDCPTCHVDKYRIGQVIRNIFENAMAVSPPNSQIYVDCRVPQTSQQPMIELHILDQGPGLSSDQRERIFEPFYTTKTKGTGLGMAICQRIVEAHGGRITIGTPVCGTEIIVELPME